MIPLEVGNLLSQGVWSKSKETRAVRELSESLKNKEYSCPFRYGNKFVEYSKSLVCFSQYQY